MARTLYDADWRALQRIVDVLDANVATQLTADAPAGLNVTAPSSEAYYAFLSEDKVRRHMDTNHAVRCYVFPTGTRDSVVRTRGASNQQRHDVFEVTVAVCVREELGADDYADTWKTLSPQEREQRRVRAILGAISDSLHANVRNADDVLQIDDAGADRNPDRLKNNPDESGSWGALRFNVHQLVLIPQQN